MQVPKKQPTHKRSAGFVRIASRAKALGIPGVGSGMAPSHGHLLLRWIWGAGRQRLQQCSIDFHFYKAITAPFRHPGHTLLIVLVFW
jgi:hypothetical protein